MELERHGLKVVLRKIDNFLPVDGGYLLAGRGGLTRKEIVRHHAEDGDGHDRYMAELETVVPLIKKWILKSPPNAGAGIRGLAALTAIGRDMAGLKTDEIRVVHESIRLQAKRPRQSRAATWHRAPASWCHFANPAAECAAL
jgi:hypothetical protein